MKLMSPYVGVLHVTTDGQVMLPLRDDIPGIFGPGMIGTFGGEVEVGESLLDAARRETKEELSLLLSPQDLIYLGQLHLSPSRYGKNQRCHFFVNRGIEPTEIVVDEGQGYVLVTKETIYTTPKITLFTQEILALFFELE